MTLKPILKDILVAVIAVMAMTSCFLPHSTEDDNKYDITDKFGLTWNADETMVKNADGTISFHARAWGGLAASMVSVDGPADFSPYESIVVEFSKPTPCITQIIFNEQIISWGKAEITRLEASLYGFDLRQIQQVALQFSKDCTVDISRIYLVKTTYEWQSTQLWEGSCKLGNWTGSLTIRPEKFDIAVAGDMLEIKTIMDKNSPELGYWQIKTEISDTQDVLIGNQDHLNEWGCASIDKGTCSLLVPLTARDVARLQSHGLHIVGFYKVVTQVNLLQ
ncbi:MAG: hypothetical protein IJT98_06220 [Prevotella sp.]|nr:hypothetical protein [Prevotella sp.]